MKKEIQKIINPEKFYENGQRQPLLDNLTSIAQEGFGSPITREDVENHVLKTGLLYLIMDDKTVIGFSSYDPLQVGDKNVLYLNGIVLRKNYQKKGIFKEINRLALNEHSFDYISMRTQNPVVYAATQSITTKIYPNETMKINQDVKELAEIIAIKHLKMPDYDRDSMVGRRTYGNCLYGKVPKHGITDMFFEKTLRLDYEKGDSVIIMGKI